MPKQSKIPPSKRAPSGKKSSRQEKDKKTPKKKRRFGQLLLTLILWGLLFGTIGFVWLWYDLPNLSQLSIASRRPRVEFLDPNGQKIIAYGDKHLPPVRLSQLPHYVPKAVMAIEDHRFYDHVGFDFLGLGRAFMTNVMAGHVVQGGSTLTQQLAKTLFLSPKRSIKRKLQELIVSVWLEQNFSKDQMLTIYLNRVYMGPGLFGFAAAAEFYFHKPVSKLSLPEAAGLAGMLKAPHTYSPFFNIDKFKDRASVVLARMQELDYISEKEYKQSIAALKNMKITPPAYTGKGRPSTRYFLDWVYNQLPYLIKDVNQDLIITTTLNSKAQHALDKAVDTFGKQKELDEAQLALIMMTKEGRVLGMIGGREYFTSSFNRAANANRQSGSVYKVFVYLNALMNGMTPHTKIKDTPVNLSGWRPKNYGWKAKGEVPLSEALAYSINTATVRIAKDTGNDKAAELAKKFGAISYIPKKLDLTTALGTLESRPLALTNAFATIANGCQQTMPYGILNIRTPGGKVLYTHKAIAGAQLADANACKDIERMMIKAVDYGTAKQARQEGKTRAAKTGTTQDHRDAWIVGYEKPYVLGIWIGYDNNQPLPNKMTGGRLPAQLFKQVLAGF